MAHPAMPTSTDRSVGELLHDLSSGTAQLIGQEIRLARSETVESLLGLKRGAVWMGMSIAFLLCAAGATVAFVILVLSTYLLAGRTWLAALIVAIVLGIAGWLCLRRGTVAMSAKALTPHQTTQSIKETAEWLKHPTRSAAS